MLYLKQRESFNDKKYRDDSDEQLAGCTRDSSLTLQTYAAATTTTATATPASSSGFRRCIDHHQMTLVE